MQIDDSGKKTFQSSAVILEGQRVAMASTGLIAPAGDEVYAIGFALHSIETAGDFVTVKLLSSNGTFKGIASEAVAIGDALYGAASGKLETTGTTARFLALSAGAGDGSMIEVIPKVFA